MSRLLYFDCSAGVSGDMILGGLIELGVPRRELSSGLSRLKARGFTLDARRSTRAGVRGTRVRVEAPRDPGHRYFRDFARILGKSRLSSAVKDRAVDLLKRLYEVEGRIHGMKWDQVHLHELGSLDTLVDVVGTLVGLEILGVDACEGSRVNVGGGDVHIEHGVMAVPAPATAELLKGVPTFSDGSDFERTTPTGALLVSGLARRFGPWPAMTVRKVGYGLGTKDPAEGRPNALRLVLGETTRGGSEAVLVLEATLDDMTPQVAGYLLDRLQEAGALDVFFTPVAMKKSRPGVNVTVLAPLARRAELTSVLFSESTTLGVRSYEVERSILERRVVVVRTRWGRVPVKVGMRDGKVLNAAPEFEDCRRIAAKHGVALKEVQQEAIALYRRRETR